MKYSLIALDLDGTLTNSEKVVTQLTYNTLMSVQKDGTRIVLASGRPVFGIIPIASQLRLNEYGGYIMANNGAQLYDCKNGECIFQKLLPNECIPQLYDISKQHGLMMFCYIDNMVVTEQPDTPFAQKACRINKVASRRVDSFLEVKDEPMAKCIIGGETEQLIMIEHQIKNEMGNIIDVYRSSPVFLEVVAPGIDKADALRRLASIAHVELKDTIAFGDAPNDISMLQAAGMGVAMGNAEDSVKAAADRVTLTNNEDGIAVFLSK